MTLVPTTFHGADADIMDTLIGTPRNLFATAVLVAAAYYSGVQVGLALTFPPATTSVLWPPNAILTAALIIVPPNAWWVCLAAALPVHILLEIGAGFSPALVGLLFLTNCSEAVMAAIGVRLLSDAPTRFDSFRRVAAFIGAAGLMAPILSSFADAAVVNLLRGEPYWDVWRARVFANVLTELSVVPPVVLGWRAIRAGLRLPGRARAAEAVALGLVLGAAATVIFKRPYLGDAMPGVPPTPMVLLLPVFGWAAIRFGVGGVSAALFGSAIVASHETAVGFRPFAEFSPASSLIAVQMILAVIAMPLMCIAGLLAERRRDTATLAARLRFEELLSTVASSFVRLPNFGGAVDECVARVCEFFRIDTAVLFHLDEPSNTPEIERQWNTPGVSSLAAALCERRFSVTTSRVLEGDTILWTSLDDIPREAADDRHAFAELGLRSMVAVPLVSGGSVRVALAMGTLGDRSLSDADVDQLRLVVDVLANARAQRQAEMEAVRSRQELAYVARRSSMGELAASMAHQLNQPLTGILSNAQAAKRMLESGTTSLPDVHDSLVDIIDDCRSARDVILRMREMLTPTDAQPVLVDMTTIVRDVALLVASDALIRRVSVAFESDVASAQVEGVRILLQQAILNVVMNAIDAVADLPRPNRVVLIRTTSDGRGEVQISVRDQGTGLPDGAEKRVFEPFFSTKTSGMGMGLAIARSIVEQHGGSITASNAPAGGVLVMLSLPSVVELTA